MLLSFIALPFILAPQVPSPLSSRWNVVLVTADDMNADSAGWMGNKLGATPNLDAFAATAHRFVNHHVSVPICQPSRAALLTGRVPHRNGALGFNPISPGVPTLVGKLKEAGWFTASLNKQAHMKPDSAFPWDLALTGSGKNPSVFGEQVRQCVKAASVAGKPFFINANITDPHRPFFGAGSSPEEKEGSVKPYTLEEVTVPSFLEDITPVRKEVAQYYSSVRRGDQSFGALMAAIKSTGHETDTVVVFLSDHGMSFPFSKATVYRNGTWSPVLLRYPGMGSPQKREEFVSSVDILPTLMELLKQPPLEGVDGRSWGPLLHGERPTDRDYVVTHVNTVSSGKSFPQRCIRTKDFSYQFHAWPNGTPQFRVEAMSGITFAALKKGAESDSKLKARVDQLTIGVPEQLFDLRSDPDERTNVSADPKYKTELTRLRQLLLAHMEKTSDPQLGNFRKQLEGRL
ncbi:sulfatase family protein [Armatimonas rosea]|uniref:N-sulfoglucosamine sulfohydrolase n=1 Tax=Armatimonas rosea TaxID=685828 RepID=A0A7W9SWA5_ARMRO|nr:sulfatase [Armatimonas rosea]MBB6053099.1 N-sulfoglucosamine sulfohydrolase [Armatimonas rosea]